MIINKAREFAIKKHAGQMYGDVDYVTGHLEKVAAIAYKYSEHLVEYAPLIRQKLIACAYLHDTLEDTDADYVELKNNFGGFIAEIVRNVTDQPGKNRKERKLLSYYLIRSSKYSVFIKLCDRLANVQSGGKLDMYKDEYYTFKCALWDHGDGLNADLWVELDTILLDKTT